MSIRLASALVLGLITAGTASAQEPSPSPQRAATAEAKAPAVTVPFFGNAICPVSGKPTKPDKYVEKPDGRRVYTCCSKCKAKVQEDFFRYYNEAYPADKVVDMKNDRCPVSGDEVGDEFVIVRGHKVHLCCSKCAANVKRHPDRTLALLQDPHLVALENRNCLVQTDEKVQPGNCFIYDGVIIDSCCGDCAGDFAKDPEKYLKAANVDLAAVKKKEAEKRAAEKSEPGEAKEKEKAGKPN